MKRLISLIISAILFALPCIALFCTKSSATRKPSFGEGYAVVRLFDENGFDYRKISDIRFAAESASTADAEDKGRLWCDAYSYFTSALVARQDKSADCNVLVTGGDFFLFHDFNFKNGYHYSESDIHLDRVVIDERLAFELFGSNDAEGMTIELGTRTLYVAGVIEAPKGTAAQLQLENKPLIIVPDYIAELEFGERAFEYYEIMMQNPVKDYALTSLSQVTQEMSALDTTNRFGILNIIEILTDFPSRSYRTDTLKYPYWENSDRGTEDTLALLLAMSAVCGLNLIANIAIYVYERKKR